VATRTDFLVQSVVRRRQTFQDLKTLFKEIERNVHAYSVKFPKTSFLPARQKTPFLDHTAFVQKLAQSTFNSSSDHQPWNRNRQTSSSKVVTPFFGRGNNNDDDDECADGDDNNTNKWYIINIS